MDGLILKNHFSLNASSEVGEICNSPLQSIGITYFNYIKIYQDGSRDLLTNNAPWIDHFYRNALYQSAATVDIEHLLPKGYFLWSELERSDPIYSQGRESFNIDNGVSFVIKRKDATLLYIFASTRENYTINNYYLRNIDLFKRFILFFNDKGSDLIKKSSKNRIYLPEKQIITPNRLREIKISISKREEFYRETPIERFYLINQSDKCYLTQKQAECAAYLVAGATAKQSAKAIGISYRTVEGYIDNIKEKIFLLTGIKPSKNELIKILRDSGVHDVVYPNKIEICK